MNNASFSSSKSTDSYQNVKINLLDKFSMKFKEILENYDNNNNFILIIEINNNIYMGNLIQNGFID